MASSKEDMANLINEYFEKVNSIHSGDIFDVDEHPIDLSLSDRVVGMELAPNKVPIIKEARELCKQLCALAPKALKFVDESVQPGKVGPLATFGIEVSKDLIDVGSTSFRTTLIHLLGLVDRFGISRMGRKNGFYMDFTVADIWQKYRLMEESEMDAYEEWYEAMEDEQP